jgi:hypothetical protein
MYNSEGRLGQSGDGEASVNVYIYKCLVRLHHTYGEDYCFLKYYYSLFILFFSQFFFEFSHYTYTKL